MKRILVFCCLFILGNATSSCKDAKKKEMVTEFKQVNVDNSYVLSLPKYLEQVSGLNNEALVQYQNTEKEVYTIMILEEKSELKPLLKPSNSKYSDRTLISLYAEMQMRSLEERVKIRGRNNPKRITINDMDSEIFEFDAKVPGVDEPIFYHLTLFEGKNDFFMLMSWTLLENKQLYKDTFDRIAKSFKPIN